MGIAVFSYKQEKPVNYDLQAFLVLTGVLSNNHFALHLFNFKVEELRLSQSFKNESGDKNSLAITFSGITFDSAGDKSQFPSFFNHGIHL